MLEQRSCPESATITITKHERDISVKFQTSNPIPKGADEVSQIQATAIAVSVFVKKMLADAAFRNEMLELLFHDNETHEEVVNG